MVCRLSSVFKKLLSRELGINKYDKYFACYQRLISNKSYNSTQLENEEIYNDIYDFLKDRELKMLTQMLERLLDSMYVALKISKHYIFVLMFYIFSCVFMVVQGFMPLITIISLVLMSGCFIYKTYEFIVNKYCFIDAHIILVYKSVLDKLILSYDNKKDD